MIVAGVDEAGRGALAGPVVAAAVILPQNLLISGLTDSKLLSPSKRERLFEEICRVAESISVRFIGTKRIETLNILHASMLAMEKAVKNLSIFPEKVLIDGNRAPKGLEAYNVQTIVGGDKLVPSISAASIVAKVLRDRLLVRYDSRYPHYGFAEHKGYGTAAHYAALLKLGPSAVHRNGFKLYKQEPLFCD